MTGRGILEFIAIHYDVPLTTLYSIPTNYEGCLVISVLLRRHSSLFFLQFFLHIYQLTCIDLVLISKSINKES